MLIHFNISHNILNKDDLRLSCRSKALNNFQIVMRKPEIEISTTVRIKENICDDKKRDKTNILATQSGS